MSKAEPREFRRKEYRHPTPIADVIDERKRQHKQWGEQNHPDGTGNPQAADIAKNAKEMCEWRAAAGSITWSDILFEEWAEADAETDPAKLRAELIQVAAVAVAWVEAIDRREKTGEIVDTAPPA